MTTPFPTQHEPLTQIPDTQFDYSPTNSIKRLSAFLESHATSIPPQLALDISATITLAKTLVELSAIQLQLQNKPEIFTT